MADKLINKVVYGGRTLLDLTGDTITPDDLKLGITAHNRQGEEIVGVSTLDSDTTDADALPAEILETKTAYVNKQKIAGSMPNNGAVAGKILVKDTPYVVPAGYHDGSGTVEIDPTEQAKIIAGNIKEGVTVLGVTGTLSPASGVKAQTKTVTPTKDGFSVLPDTGFDYLSQVTVDAIPYVESENTAGGLTATIG